MFGKIRLYGLGCRCAKIPVTEDNVRGFSDRHGLQEEAV